MSGRDGLDPTGARGSSALSFFAPCARGLEPLLADELRRLRLRGVRPQRAGVLFKGDVRDAYRALLWSRLASRVLLSLGEVDASSADALYDAVRDVAWEDHLSPGGTMAVDAVGTNAALRNSQYTAVRVKDAVVDRLRDRFGRRPSVDTAAPDVRVNVVVGGERARLSIDLAGEPLHRRGYREPGVQAVAPMKETLAAALLEIAGWREIATRGGAFADPLCGSGTLAIEAAWVAGDVAPGILRAQWGFDGWLGHDADAWASLLDEADARAEAGRVSIPLIGASDIDARAVHLAQACVRRAGLEKVILVDQRALAEATPPAGAPPGLAACNPPYGERLGRRAELPALYTELARALRERFRGWGLAVITSDDGLERGLGARAGLAHELYKGRIPAKVYVFDAGAFEASAVEPRVVAGARGVFGDRGDGPTLSAAIPRDTAADAFANRLRKMAKHVGTWARRTGVTCYRVYDADLPDYNVAIDVYRGAGPDEGRTWVHMAEYAPPPGVDHARSAERLRTAASVAAEVLGVAAADVFVKRRERQRGSSQYVRLSASGVTATVAEGGLLFEVDLADYLDTGLFLDHRETRAWVRELAEGARFLNLFAYTGSVTVYAAAGGALTTTTVDLSRTYLEWARRNLAMNGFEGAGHTLVRADVLAWLQEAQGRADRYDLIFCDPPTFSNSKRMDGTWDVQRDHVALLTGVAELLADGGTLVFSCNRRRFELDEASLVAAGLTVRDVTRRTTPKDFDRTPPAHLCWTLRRA